MIGTSAYQSSELLKSLLDQVPAFAEFQIDLRVVQIVKLALIALALLGTDIVEQSLPELLLLPESACEALLQSRLVKPSTAAPPQHRAQRK